ncbi:MAG: ABC transporter substrate-binding protein [Nakamurella sp.]
MNHQDQVEKFDLSRRQLMKTAGLTLATTMLLGACQASPAKSTQSGTASSAGPRLFQGWYPFDAPPKGNFNLLPGVTEAITIGYFYDWILLPGAMYYWASQKYYYLLADDSTSLSKDGSILTYKVRPGLTWSDGKPVTAQDVYTTWTLEYLMGNAAFTYVDKITKTDDMTVTFHIKTPAPIAEYYLLRGQIVSDAVYGKFMARAEPLVRKQTPIADPTVAKLVKDISSFKPKNVVASGPFNFDFSKVSSQSVTLVKNAKGYRADKVNFDSAVVNSSDTLSVLASLALSGKMDYGTGGWPVSVEKELQAKGMRIIRPPTYFGPALFINYDKLPEFADKRVRQALAYAIDRSQEGQAALGESGKDIKLMAGFSDLQVPQWLSTADQAKLIHYDHNPSKAAELLTAAGWKKQGSNWVTPQGKPASYTILAPTQSTDWVTAAKDLQSQLGTLGITVTLKTEDQTQEPLDIQHGNFEWAIQAWGSAGNPFPTASFTADILQYSLPVTKPKKGMAFPLQQNTDVVGKVDFATEIPDSGQGANLDALKAKITKLALAFNELLPIVPLFERYDNDGVNLDHIAGFPDDSDPIYRNSIYADNFVTILMFEGTLRPAK